jgi:hypothetical protein
MSDEQNEELENLAEGVQPRRAGGLNVSMQTLEPDWFLRHIANFANKFGVETSITLQVGGVQVTGMTISAENYFRQMAETFGGGFAQRDVGESFTKLINGFADDMKPTEGDDNLPTYIHLSNAHLSAPGGPIPENEGKPILWRARISAVDGFYLGSAAAALAPKPAGGLG